MGYRKSIARREQAQHIEFLRQQAHRADKLDITIEIKQCVYRNALFQTSASLEVYVMTVLEDWLHKLKIEGKALKDVPKELVFWTAAKLQTHAFREYLFQQDEGKLVRKLSSINGLNLLFKDDSSAVNLTNFDNVRDRKYPSKKNLISLFRRFGIDNIMTEIHRKGARDYSSKLESFSDMRTEIAHQFPTPELVIEDVNDILLSIADIINQIDRVLHSHVVSISGGICWKVSRL